MISHVLSNCVENAGNFDCISTVESVWFKITNQTSATKYISTCDPIFYKKYGDITYSLQFVRVMIQKA